MGLNVDGWSYDSGTPPMGLLPGTRLGPYEILSLLGSGGMGEVYRAIDSRLGRDVAVKVLLDSFASSPDRLRRFEHEARAAAALNHPNIIALYDVGSYEGSPYIVCELLDGLTLRQLLAQGRLSVRQALDVSVALTRGLAAAHRRSIVHRDLKPENVFLTTDGVVKILDFGLAKLRSPEPGSESPTASWFTAEGVVIGTAAYMSPEQARGQSTDARSDIFSFGIVLYEMLAGQRPFLGESGADVIAAILNQAPPRLKQVEIPAPLEQVVARCLEKRPGDRYQSAHELATALEALSGAAPPPAAELSRQPTLPAPSQARLHAAQRRSSLALLVALSLVVAILAAGSLYARRARQRWALEVALPEIARLAGDERDLIAAYQLATEAEQAIPDSPELLRRWGRVSRYVAVHTEPPGATVRIKPYGSGGDAWTVVGVTPFDAERVPRAFFHWSVERSGYATVDSASSGVALPQSDALGTLKLEAEANVPSGMVRVHGGPTELDVPGLLHLVPVALPDYWLDRDEVTNRAFKDFLDTGGYSRSAYWAEVVEEAAPGSSVVDAVSRFRDLTGRPGPAGWKLGEFPRGEEDHPVSGVSWFEAAAYCKARDQQLPTVYHWYRAAGTEIAPQVVPVSNFSGQGVVAVESSGALGPFGTYDMAGNVREWVWNAGGDRRFVLGGAWNEPTYLFKNPDGSPPFERPLNTGFRCMKVAEATTVPEGVFAAIPPAPRESGRPSVPDSEFRIYERFYAYDKRPLEAGVERVDHRGGMRRERITLRAAYGDERFPLLLFLPEQRKPRYPVVVYFPGSEALYARTSEELWATPVEFLVKSGRAVCLPVYKGTYERQTGMKDDDPDGSINYRDHMVMWAQDMARAIDYLETRPELDTTRLAYYGLSWGAALGAILPAVEKRIQLAVLDGGGFFATRARPEADQRTFAPRVGIPVLMVNGRYDYFFPVRTSQQPLFQMLGSAVSAKTHVLLESGHWELSPERIRVILDWLDELQG